MQSNRRERSRKQETCRRGEKDNEESRGSTDGWLKTERNQKLKWAFDTCRVKKGQKSKGKGIWFKMSRNWGKKLFRRQWL